MKSRTIKKTSPLLEIKNLQVSAGDKKILRGLDLEIKPGEVHAIMGPNGSGKSSLAHVLAGREDYEITGGSIKFNDRDLLKLSPDERARQGIFLAFQYPVEVPGVGNAYFLKAAVNAQRRTTGLPELDALDFLKLAREKIKSVGLQENFLERSLNTDFSGGEKKRNEIFQMAMLEPRLAVLDETDSGLDIDALKTVAKGINKMRSKGRAIILITHYQRLLKYIVPDKVHVLQAGRIKQSGDKALAAQLEKTGYQLKS